jgi:hypothetical protein
VYKTNKAKREVQKKLENAKQSRRWFLI